MICATDIRVITHPNQIKIEPSDINVEVYFDEAFGWIETARSANWVVRLCQKLGDWKPFSLKQLEALYHTTHPLQEPFSFNGLDTRGFVIQDAEGHYLVTVDFVERCYKASPAQTAQAAPSLA